MLRPPRHGRWRLLLAAAAPLACLAVLGPQSAAGAGGAPGLTPSCPTLALGSFSAASLTAAVSTTKCLLPSVTHVERNLPTGAKSQVIACRAMEKVGQWDELSTLWNTDDQMARSFELADGTFDRLAVYFGNYYLSGTGTPKAGRAWALAAEQLLGKVVAGNGHSGKLKPLPDGTGFPANAGVSYYLRLVGSSLQAENCSKASQAAGEVGRSYSKANAAGVAFISTVHAG